MLLFGVVYLDDNKSWCYSQHGDIIVCVVLIENVAADVGVRKPDRREPLVRNPVEKYSSSFSTVPHKTSITAVLQYYCTTYIQKEHSNTGYHAIYHKALESCKDITILGKSLCQKA